MSIMSIGGTLGVEVNTPRAVKSQKHDGNDEIVQGLPEYARQEAYRVDEYPACPESWMRSSPGVSSWFVPVKKNRGLWLDFNYCWEHNMHVAVLPSVQGLNPITGQRQNSLALEQYREHCPVHDEPFQDERFCGTCKFHWPGQNYLTTTATPQGRLWIDGFRAKDGVVRQYVFTEEESRGVAAAMIGEDRVFAIGVAFYLSKTPKPPMPSFRFSKDMLAFDSVKCFEPSPYDFDGGHMMKGGAGLTRSVNVSHMVQPGSGVVCSVTPTASSTPGAAQAKSYKSPSVYFSDQEPVAVRRLEVAAGARIDQRIHLDRESLDFYEAQPAGRVVINYASREEVDRIVKAGRREEATEGFLAGLQVGNS